MTFTRRYLDPAWPINYKALCIFEDKLCIWDHGPNHYDGRVLHTADGLTWTTLFSRTAVQIGWSGSFWDGNGMAVYNGNLFITKYKSTPLPRPRVIEWDGTNVHLHLESPLYPQPDNAMASNLVVWDGKLWCLLDVTSGVANNRRVVYYYDGASWTPITNYVGEEHPSYLNYSTGANLPELNIRHRTTRLFVFNDELYLIATRWYDAGAKWAWEVWKFDATTYGKFTKLFDSDVFDDGYALGAIIEFEGRVYILGNFLLANGNAGVIGRLYSSADMENWTVEGESSLFEDEFDDAIRHPRWTDEPNNGAVDEAGGVLTLAIANGVDGYWWQPNVENAPFAKFFPKTDNIAIVTKLNSYNVNEQTSAGLIIGNTTDIPDTDGGYCYSFTRLKGGGLDGLYLRDMGKSPATATYVAETTLPIWLRIVAGGSGAGSAISFDYSTDGENWTTAGTRSGLTWSLVGLHARNWGLPKLAISAPFEFFHVRKVIGATGFPYGEVLHEGKFYLNCTRHAIPRNTWIRRWEGRHNEFTLDQEITTNPYVEGGGLAVFNGDLYAGKRVEVYGEPGTNFCQTRLKRDSLPLLEIGYKDMFDNKHTERVAPIDTRAPDRFYHGRIKQMSSLKRAVDDKTGLFQIADMSITLANADKHYSQLLASHILKNQEATLYHAWTEEAEVMRLEVIKLIVEDHSMKGPDFMIKLKDITQKYFTMKVPENICTKDDYPLMSDEHVGRCKPEILGKAYLPWATPPATLPYEHNGAVEAVYIDTIAGWFIAANSALHDITEVFVDDVPQTEGGVGFDYTWYILHGNTYINFEPGSLPTVDQVVTFNAEGYSLAAWNSAAGYIQNLAYIIQYYLRYIMGIPASLINAASFATLAGYYVDMGVDLNGYLIIQDRTDAMEILRQLLFTGGAKGFMALDGKFNVARKNICNWQIASVDQHIFEQIELFGSPHRKWNLTSAINTVNAQFGYIPWQNLYTGAKSEYRDNRFERPMEDDIRDRKKWVRV